MWEAVFVVGEWCSSHPSLCHPSEPRPLAGDPGRRDGWGTRVFAGVDDLGVGADVSRITSAAGLSSRRPRKAAWRTRLSAVHVAKRTCATSVGLTQYAPLRASAGGFSKGVEDWAR